jgi:hypothetical protein
MEVLWSRAGFRRFDGFVPSVCPSALRAGSFAGFLERLSMPLSKFDWDHELTDAEVGIRTCPYFPLQ